MRLEKDILEIIKDIQDINKQINSKNQNKEQLQIINFKAKAKFPKETAEYEMTCSAISGNPTITPINIASIDLLLNRLPLYKNLYLNELRKKCGETEYLDILREYKI